MHFKIDIREGVKFELGCATPIVEGVITADWFRIF
jgi:hypothetical protein